MAEAADNEAPLGEERGSNSRQKRSEDGEEEASQEHLGHSALVWPSPSANKQQIDRICGS